jgi:hypothetical protein
MTRREIRIAASRLFGKSKAGGLLSFLSTGGSQSLFDIFLKHDSIPSFFHIGDIITCFPLLLPNTV